LKSGLIARGHGTRGTLRLRGAVAMPASPAGPVEVLLTDANGTLVCGSVGGLHSLGGARTAHGRVAGSNLAVKITRSGAVTITGHNVDLSKLDQPTITVGLGLGSDRFVAGGAFRSRGSRRWVYP
jgi:hypothetical protein